MKYEYKFLTFDTMNARRDPGEVEESLNELGADGWRVVEMHQGSMAFTILVERLLPTEIESRASLNRVRQHSVGGSSNAPTV